MSASPPKRSELSRARNLGSGGGVDHWWSQRVSALILMPLFIWFMIQVPLLARFDQVWEVMIWMQSPVNMGALSGLVIVGFYHAAFGAQTVLEDYISCFRKRIILILLMRGALLVGAVISIYSILKTGLAL